MVAFVGFSGRFRQLGPEGGRGAVEGIEGAPLAFAFRLPDKDPKNPQNLPGAPTVD
jgi:hypothetical protein